ncbi:hypothetical protein BDV28DRAFT_146672 [Aspergillus coremiiformis]|uniref:Uncharacterized protein n=1 Tax=Aspergillus coremiiformis TaxID=138285 RepID=A0A5N6ZB26_9EURO|nr:hypothetical protein BDV28DRAFT_146672 [Aspergillus coremiiformis]
MNPLPPCRSIEYRSLIPTTRPGHSPEISESSWPSTVAPGLLLPTYPTPWTPTSTMLDSSPKPPHEKRPSPAPESNHTGPPFKKQCMEPANYADLLQLYERVKRDLTSRYSFPEQESTRAPWVAQVLLLLDHANDASDAHRDMIRSMEDELLRLGDLLKRIKDTAPLVLAIASAEHMMRVNDHDVEGKKIVQDRINRLEWSLEWE